MSDATRCDKCGRIIAENQLPCITVKVDGAYLTQDESPLKFELHESCWKKIEKELKQ